MISDDNVTIICKNCNQTATYPRFNIPKRCQKCDEPFEIGEFGKNWWEERATDKDLWFKVATKSVVIVGGVTVSLYVANVWLLGELYPGIGSLFLWQFSTTIGIFFLVGAIIGGALETTGQQISRFIKDHVRIILFLCFFLASIIAIPITVTLSGTPLAWSNLIIGVESNILASFVFVILYEVLIQRRFPWHSK